MKAVIRSYRGGRHTQRDRHFILVPSGISKRSEASKLKGKIVTWKSPAGKLIKGKVADAHGAKGCVRVIMEKGLPGQAVGETMELTE